MELVPADVDLSFEVTFDSPTLDVAMSVFDTTSSPATLVQGPIAMQSVVGNTYVGYFNPDISKTYLIFKAVYTDDTFETLDDNYSQGTETIVAEDIGGGGGSSSQCGAVIGFVNNPQNIVGFVNCDCD